MPKFTSRAPRLFAAAATLTMAAALASPAVASADDIAGPNQIVLNDDAMTVTPGIPTAITFTRPAEYDYCVSPQVFAGTWESNPHGVAAPVFPRAGETSGGFITTQAEYDAVVGTPFEEHFFPETFTFTAPLWFGDYSAVGYCVVDQTAEEEIEVDFIRHFTVEPVGLFGSLSTLFGSLDLS